MTDSASSIKQKISFTFTKLGVAKFFSHHDIMRHFERSLKRAGLNVNHSKGFNPRPRLVFPHPLPLGVASECEEIEVEFSEEYDLQDLLKRLSPTLRPCIDLITMTPLKCSKKGRVVSSCTYRIDNFPASSQLERVNTQMLAAEEIIIERGHGRKRKNVEMRKFIESSELCENGIVVRLHHFTYGAGRADEIGKYLSDKLTIDWHTLNYTKTAMSFRE